jgi:protein subunit release factor B
MQQRVNAVAAADSDGARAPRVWELSDDELLAQCVMQTFRAGGPGGQHQNTTDSAVRLVHPPSGLMVVSRSERSQHQNRRICLARLRDRLRQRAHRPRPRVKTRPSRRARARRLDGKRHQAKKKQRRQRPKRED